jgi:hypothetical protein
MLQKINSAELLPSGFSCQVYKNNQAGNVAVVVALAMVVLLTMFAFVIDAGYLYGARNKYQNGVEAAAMAGAVSLCDGDPEGVARQIAIDNGLPAGSITVQTGFYDENDLYGDFGVYKNFVADEEAGYPEEFNNAVMVKLNKNVDTLMGGFVGKDEVTMGAAAVAYVTPYGLLSLGDEDGMGIKSDRNWEDAHPPELIDMGMIHANNEINFIKPPVLTGSNRVTAVNDISNCPEGILVAENVSIPPIDWEGLRADADNGGLVITLYNFPVDPIAYDADDSNRYKEDSYGNRYIHDEGGYKIRLHDGDYGGAVYYISEERGKFGIFNTIYVQGMGNGDTYATNLTIASEPAFMFERPMGGALYLGGENNDTVRIYCKKDIGSATAGFNQRMRGVIFRTEKNFDMRSSSTHPSPDDPASNHKMRIIAGESIKLHGHYYNVGLILNGKFGPPCRPFRVFLGEL